jgi:hypothetical protein
MAQKPSNRRRRRRMDWGSIVRVSFYSANYTGFDGTRKHGNLDA